MTYAERASQGSKPKIAKKLAVRPAKLDGRSAGAEDVKLVFFGSGPVGAATLQGLSSAGFDFEAIVTKPKPASHRGDFPVLEFAKAKGIALHTPTSPSQTEALFKTQEFSSPIGLVVDYGIVLPESVLKAFKLGIVNSHFSLLPQWRGADPITFALLSGQKQTGVSLMLIDEELDTGKLLAQAEYEIADDEDITTLTTNLVELSNKMLIEVLPRYILGEVILVDQDPNQEPSYSRRLTKQDGQVNFKKSAEQIEREVRAYLGWPKSQAKIFGHDVIITEARVAKDQTDGSLVIKCTPGWLEIQELRAPSGKIITGSEFLLGYSSGK